MLPTSLISALQAYSGSGKPLITVDADAAKQAIKLEPGKQFQAEVQSRISEGLFKVQVAGQTLQMRLPANIRSGDVIRLEVIATQPRITFSMIASTNPLSTPEQIGATARMLSNLADMPLERPVVKQLGQKAVWEANQAVPDAKLLAGALREILGKSGLFYESHQAQWVRGERSTNQLLEEPQNVLTGRSAPPSGPDRQALPTASFTDAQKSLQALRETGSLAPGIKSDQAASTNNAISQPIAKELLQLVQQQLHALEHHHLGWLGQIWPGQQMQWEIQGDPENHPRRQDERQWSTEMELSLPKLGDIHARLVFVENGMQLTLRAADQTTFELFNTFLPNLKDALAAADIPLTNAVVEKS